MSVPGRLLIIIAVSAAGLLVDSAQATSVSCVTPPPDSPAVFTGRVLSTERDGRIAQVRTDDGRTVEVRGTPSEDNAMTTVDRAYGVGTRYEFHPVNTTDPFQDNICTATHALAPVSATTSPPDGVSAPGTAAPLSTRGATWQVAGGSLAVLVAAAGLLVIRLRQRRTGG